MTGGYETAVVRLLTGTGATAGLGVLVSGNAIVTCAHVVNTALGRAQREQTTPAGEVLVEFPLAGVDAVRRATVEAWAAPPLDGAGGGGDVAGLVLGEDAPSSAKPARFSTATGTPGSELRVFGYPGSPPRSDGAWVDLDLKGPVARQLIQVESRNDQTIKAQPGYSGSPVWSDGAGMVIGLLHATGFGDEPERDAYIVSPATIATAWEDQFDYLLVPPNPYRGLEPFTLEHADAFFGRDAEIDELSARVESQPVTVVVGPSGVGKSSLVQAGLIPRLLRARTWTVALARPGKDPWYRLASSLLRAQQGPAVNLSQDDVDEVMRRIRAEGLEPTAAFLRSQDRPLLVVIDQFEEALTDGSPDTDLLDLLLPEDADVLRVVLTLRADFLPGLLQVPGMGRRLSPRTFLLSSLPTERIREAVERPAASRGITFQRGLVDEIVADTAAGSLPLLEFTLTRLWHTQKHKTVTFAGYYAMGRVAGALDLFADRQLTKLDAASRAVVDRVLLRLVRDDPPLTTRLRVVQPDLGAEEWRAIQHLAGGRLVVTGTGPDGVPYAELAHEALISSWRRLSQLVADNAEFLGWLAGIQRRAGDDPLPEARVAEARRWLEVRADDIPETVRNVVSASEAVIEARIAERTRARITEAARVRALLVAESLRLASEARDAGRAEPERAFLVAWEALLRDRNELSEAVFRETLDRLPAAVTMLISADESDVNIGFLDHGTVFAAQQYHRSGSLQCKVELRGLDGTFLGSFPIPGVQEMVVAVPPGGGHLLTYRDGVLRRHDLSGAVQQEISLRAVQAGGHHSSRSLSFSDRGTCLLHEGDTAWLVDLVGELTVVRTFNFVAEWSSTQERDHHLHDPFANVFKAVLDRGGDVVVSIASDGVRVWEVAGLAVVELGEKSPASVGILPNAMIATGGTDGEGATWDGRNGACRGVYREAADGLDLIIRTVNPSGTHFATTVNGSGIIDVRDSSGESQACLRGPDGHHAWSAAFSPDGLLLAAGADDGMIRVWAWCDPGDPVVLPGHEATVHEVVFHPEEQGLLLSADHGGAVRLSRLQGAQFPPLQGHNGPVRSLVTHPTGVIVSADVASTMTWSADGAPLKLGGPLRGIVNSGDGSRTFVLTVDDNGVGRLWELRFAAPPKSFAELSAPARPDLGSARSTISPDGRHVVLVNGDRATLWSTKTGPIAELVGADPQPGDLSQWAAGVVRVDPVYRGVVGVGFRPDGTRLAVALKNGAVWIWTVHGDVVTAFVTDSASPDRTFDMACDPQGHWIATGVRNEVGLWDWDGHRVGLLPTKGYKVFRVAFSPCGERILTIADNPNGLPFALPELWSRDGTRLATMDWATTYTGAVPEFDVRRRYVLLPGKGGLSILDWDGGYLARLEGSPRSQFLHHARSPDGDLIAALFDDGRTRIWSFPDRRRTKTLWIGSNGRIAFSPDGRLLLAGTESGSITRHAVDVDDLLPSAAERVDRVLSREELERFGIDVPLLDADTLGRYRRG